jgi:hypothetical protein
MNVKHIIEGLEVEEKTDWAVLIGQGLVFLFSKQRLGDGQRSGKLLYSHVLASTVFF